MNYIKLLTAAFEKFYHDQRLNPTHVSLYMALFQAWNSCKFANVFFADREELMKISKIGSKTTYHRCITDLHSWKYLSYFPSKNPFSSSKVKMAIFSPSDETVSEQYNPVIEPKALHYNPKIEQVIDSHSSINGPVLDSYNPKNGQALVSNINKSKQTKDNKQPKDRLTVINFFKENGSDAIDAKKFFAFYDAQEWYLDENTPVQNWKALAVSWIKRSNAFGNSHNKKQKKHSIKDENLKTSKNKNYGEPL